MYNFYITKIVPEVTMIEDADSCIYVVEGEKYAIVIDTGYGFYNIKKVVEEVTEKPLLVICTDGHIDHAFGAHYFDKIYMNKNDLPLYEKLCKQRRGLRERFFREYNLTPEEFELWCNATAKEIEFVSQGKVFDIGGNTLEVVSLRGHTPGNIGLIDRKHRILFSGDGIISQVWMQMPEATTIEDYLNTVKALKSYCKDFDAIYMGHRRNFKPVSFIDDLESVLNDLIAGKTGERFVHKIASGMIYRYKGCEVVYDPERIR